MAKLNTLKTWRIQRTSNIMWHFARCVCCKHKLINYDQIKFRQILKDDLKAMY